MKITEVRRGQSNLRPKNKIHYRHLYQDSTYVFMYYEPISMRN